MAFWFEKLIYWGLLLVGHHSSIHFPDFCTKKDPTIGVGMFIVLEKPSSASKVMERTFITLNGPPKPGEGIIVLIEGHTPTGTVPRSSCPMIIPPKPPDRVAVSIISACRDHC